MEIYQGIVQPPPASDRQGVMRRVELERTHTVVVHARLVGPDGKTLARFTNWPEPFKFIAFPDPEMRLRLQSDGRSIQMEVKKPAKCAFFSVPGEKTGTEIKWSDNAVDLFPGDVQTMTVEGLEGRKVAVSRLGGERPAVVPFDHV